MNPSNLTSAAAGQHALDLRNAARRARAADLVRVCRETVLERAAHRLHLGRRDGQPCPA
jgi:hypothetical protein